MVTVMIVDSEEKRGSRISSILRANGYESTPVTSIATVSTQRREQWPDVILMACTDSDSTGEPFYDDPSGNGKVPETMGPAFDTPSLRELWLTAPYLHDGRSPTLEDMLTVFNLDDRHGKTSGLSEAELSALVAFLLALPLTDSEVQELSPN